MRRPGRFAPIEVLFMSAIVGITAAIAIPDLLHALGEGRQNRTVAEIRTIAHAIQAYAPANADIDPDLIYAANRARQKRTMTSMRTIGTAVEAYAVDNGFYPRGVSNLWGMEDHISPTYLKNMPSVDGWRNRLGCWSPGGFYRIISYGRDAASGPTSVGPTTDFDDDIIYSCGEFVSWPEGVQHD
jgi:general secretion pathway protein G